MPSVSQKVVIHARPEEVFELITRVTDFSKYSSRIKSVKEVSAGVYRWRVEFFGIVLEWDSVVTESRSPERFVWKAMKGVYNTGSYVLKPTGEDTLVTFKMEYRLKGRALDKLTGPLMAQVTSLITKELLRNIKKEFEG